MNKFIENLTNAQQLNDHHCHWLVRLRCPGGRTAATFRKVCAHFNRTCN